MAVGVGPSQMWKKEESWRKKLKKKSRNSRVGIEILFLCTNNDWSLNYLDIFMPLEIGLTFCYSELFLQLPK